MNSLAPCFPFTALLLAGGRSTRMGRDKAALVVEGVPLWQRQLATLRALEPAELLISGPCEGPWAGCGVEIVPDAQPGLGPLGGLATILPRMKCERVLVLAVDLPAMTADFLRGLLARCPDGSGLVPMWDERFEPLAAIYPRDVFALAQRSIEQGDRSMQSFVRAGIAAGLLRAHLVGEAERPLFRNWNAPGDVA